MSEKEQEIPLANIIGRHDILDFQTKLFMVLLLIVFVAVTFVFYVENEALREENAKLRESNIMYGYPNQEGVFVSTKTMPNGHIKSFVNQFVNNFYNYNPDSIQSNMKAAKGMMCANFKNHISVNLAKNEKRVIKNRINQDFDIDGGGLAMNIEKDSKGRGYKVSFNAEKVRSTGGDIYDRRKGSVELILMRVKHSAHYEWGIVLCGMDENMKKVSLI